MNGFTIDEAGSDLSQLVARVEPGEEILLARGAGPVAKSVSHTPPPPKPKRRPGALKGMINVVFDPGR